MAEWKFPVFGHGGDYNPDQWLHDEHVLEEDVRLMKLSHCNIMSIGIFAWAALEPEEGVYTFDWLERVIDRLYENGISVLLATPSGARPAWMSQRYPEVLRVREDGLRNTHGIRHNHCFTSPTYRLKVHEINTRLAERFGKHPGVVGWHVSNEFSGCCYCDLCKNAFRDYLKREYGSLDEINRNWWTAFWSHTYTDWSQIDPPSRYGEDCVMGLNLAWQRFITYQTVDFIKNEIEPLRRLTPDLPVTTNFMNRFDGLDYSKFKDVIDFACWDSYPLGGRDANSDAEIALNTAFYQDYIRSILQKPWVLMESTPSVTNWQEVSKLKRPGMHLLSSMLAVAHGADSIQYFQWRKSRGASEKLHGAVVDHVGHENTRVFRDVTSVAVPNDATNYGRALLVLRDAGLLELGEYDGTPLEENITSSKVELYPVNASMTYQYLSDVDAAVINGNYAASYGVDPDSGIFYESIDLSDDKFTCLIACRTADLDNETYKRVAEVFCSEVTSKVVEEKFNGFFKLVWEEDTAEDAADTETEVTSETTEG